MTESLKLEIQELIGKLNLDCEIEEFQDNVNWFNLTLYHKLSERFIRHFKNYVGRRHISEHISEYQILSENFIREFKDTVDWYSISKYQILSEAFIREFQDSVYWPNISQYQKLSEGFIHEFKDKVYWKYISECQLLTESFICEFQDKVVWYNISKYQILSKGFIREFQDEVNWYRISVYQNLSDDFRKEFNLDIATNNTRNWTLEQRANMVLESEFKLYINDTRITKENLSDYVNKLNDGYIIGYKTIREDRYSHYSFHFRYEKGKIYETNCDYNLENKNSFGFGVFSSKEKCIMFKSTGIIIKIKVQLKDLAVIVGGGQKIRTSKIEVLS